MRTPVADADHAVQYHRRQHRRPVPVVLLGVVLLGALLGAQVAVAGGGFVVAVPGEQRAMAQVTPQQPEPAASPTAVVAEAAAVELRFEVGSDLPRAGDEQLLDDLAARTLADDRARLVVTGHADASNDPALEQQIAEQRAFAVAGLLVERGVPAERTRVESAGADEAEGRGADGNRRVVVELLRD